MFVLPQTSVLTFSMPCCSWLFIKTEPKIINMVAVNPPPPPAPPRSPDSNRPTHGKTLITDTYNDWLLDCADSFSQTAFNWKHIGLKPLKTGSTEKTQSQPWGFTLKLAIYGPEFRKQLSTDKPN